MPPGPAAEWPRSRGGQVDRQAGGALAGRDARRDERRGQRVGVRRVRCHRAARMARPPKLLAARPPRARPGQGQARPAARPGQAAGQGGPGWVRLGGLTLTLPNPNPNPNRGVVAWLSRLRCAGEAGT